MSDAAENFCPVWFQRLITRVETPSATEEILSPETLGDAEVVLLTGQVFLEPQASGQKETYDFI